jgi:hypothetical protein
MMGARTSELVGTASEVTLGEGLFTAVKAVPTAWMPLAESTTADEPADCTAELTTVAEL